MNPVPSMLLTLIIHILAFTTFNNIVPVDQHRVSVVCKHTLLTHTQKPWLMHTTATQTQTNTQQHWSHITTRTPTRSRHTETHARTRSHAWWLRAGWGVSLWRVSYLSALISPGRHMNGLLFLHAIYQRKRVGITKTTSPMMHFSVPPALSQARTARVGRFLPEPACLECGCSWLYHISALF